MEELYVIVTRSFGEMLVYGVFMAIEDAQDYVNERELDELKTDILPLRSTK